MPQAPVPASLGVSLSSLASRLVTFKIGWEDFRPCVKLKMLIRNKDPIVDVGQKKNYSRRKLYGDNAN